ncbi:lipopolysaccharide biosynthesis protein [Limisphaera sp. 4302-co]|uniref:lipopolysaccharide biosynthesis protein n=1 Tax=Limisphaera sp. 4302-co TaxID=3400417 RepID=UPI003C22C8C3
MRQVQVLSFARFFLSATGEQTIFAFASFAGQVFLARHLTQDQYGLFALASTFLAVAASLHVTLWGEPVVVYGKSRFQGLTLGYFRRVFQLQLYFGAALATAAFALALLILRAKEWLYTSLAIALALPSWLTLTFYRRAVYVFPAPHLAALGGVLYTGIFLPTLFLLHKCSLLQSDTAFLAVFLGSLGSLLVVRHFKPFCIRQNMALNKKDIFLLHFSYGRWVIPALALSGLAGNLPYWTLASAHSIEDVARLRVLALLYTPINLIAAALSQLALSSLAPVSVQPRAFVFRLKAATGLAIAFTAPFSLATVIWGQPALQALFDNQYASIPPLYLSLLAPIPVLLGIAGMMGTALRALNRPQRVLALHLSSSALVLFLATILPIKMGLPGALLSLTLLFLLQAISGAYLVIGTIKQIRNGG